MKDVFPTRKYLTVEVTQNAVDGRLKCTRRTMICVVLQGRDIYPVKQPGEGKILALYRNRALTSALSAPEFLNFFQCSTLGFRDKIIRKKPGTNG